MKPANVAKYLGGAVLGVLLAVMAVTNPSQAAYDEFAARTLAEYLEQEFCDAAKGVPELLDNLLSSGCRVLLESNQSEIKQYLSDNTDRQNLIFLSLYTTDLPTHRVRTIGVFHNFFVYKATEG